MWYFHILEISRKIATFEIGAVPKVDRTRAKSYIYLLSSFLSTAWYIVYLKKKCPALCYYIIEIWYFHTFFNVGNMLY